MVILIVGSSDLVRGTVASAIVGDGGEWQHLSLESIFDVAATQGLPDDDGALQLRIACHCIRALVDDGAKLVVTTEEIPEPATLLMSELGDVLTGVHLGSPDEIAGSPLHHVINTNGKTAKEIVTIIEGLTA